MVSHRLASLIGSGPILAAITYVKRSNSPSTYFIHYNLINKTRNLSKRKKSEVLAKFHVQGLPCEKVSYDASPQQVFGDSKTDSFIKSIILSVRDKDPIIALQDV